MNKKILTAITIIGIMLITIGVRASPPKSDIEVYRNCELGIMWGRIVGRIRIAPFFILLRLREGFINPTARIYNCELNITPTINGDANVILLFFSGNRITGWEFNTCIVYYL